MKKEDEIITVAKTLLSKFGFKKTTMEDIAREARIAKATLYHYFKSKEDILREIIKREGEILRKRLLKVVEKARTAEEKIRNYAITRFRFLRKLALYYKSLRDEYYSHFNFIERERKNFDEFEISTLQKILDEGVKNKEFEVPDTRLYAFLLLQSMKGLEYPIATGIALKIDGKELKLEEALNILLGILIKGIGREKK